MKGAAIYLFALLSVLPFISRAKTFIVETSDEHTTTPPPILKEQLSRGKKTPKKNRKNTCLKIMPVRIPLHGSKEEKKLSSDADLGVKGSSVVELKMLNGEYKQKEEKIYTTSLSVMSAQKI